MHTPTLTNNGLNAGTTHHVWRQAGQDSGISDLVAALAGLSKLEELQVMSCGLTSDCAPLLAASIRCMSRLQTLQMDNNPLHDEGIAALTPTLSHLTQLRWLTMASTELTLAGATAIVTAVEGHKMIERCSDPVTDSAYRVAWPEVLRKPWVSIY